MKKILRSPVMTALLFVLATVMLFAGTIGGTQAVFADTSSDYLSQLSMKHIGVALYENGGDPVGERTYGDNTVGGDSSTGESHGWRANSQDGPLVINHLIQKGAETGDKLIKIGKRYPFEITAKNTGTIPHYLRMVVYRYWVDENGNKIIDTRYDPQMIETAFVKDENKDEYDEYNSQYWYKDPFSTPERSIYYYRTILPIGETTKPLYNKLDISTNIRNFVTITNNQYEYFYNGKQFEVYIEVDAVQTHHAQDAWRSAWGVPGEILTTLGIPND